MVKDFQAALNTLLQCPVCKRGDMERLKNSIWQCDNCQLYFPEYRKAPLLQGDVASQQHPSITINVDVNSRSPQKTLSQKLYSIVSKTPLSPHFSEFYFSNRGLKRLLSNVLKGVVIEVGCGDKDKKQFFLRDCQYITTDYVGWGEKVNEEGGVINEFVPPWQPAPMIWADAAQLPFKDNTVDTWIALNTLEHIPFIEEVFSEANRVLKPHGRCLISIPWLYRLHGGKLDVGDYARYTKNAIEAYANRVGLILEEEFCNTSFAQMISTMINQYFVRIIFEKTSSRISHLLLGILFTPIFFISNIISLIFRGADRRWATHYFFVLRKSA